MGLATLGFSDGPKITFRLDPQSVEWSWEPIVSSTETIGGRVVQIIGATLSDVQIKGQFGQDRSAGLAGDSWRQAESFYKKIRDIMEFQSRDATDRGLMHRPAVFTYGPRNWRFSVYVKDLSDPEGGGSVAHDVGKFSHSYVLTLFVMEELSDDLVKAGSSNGVLDKKRQDAITAYMARISDGIGWHFSEFNGHAGTPGTASPKPPDDSSQIKPPNIKPPVNPPGVLP